MVLDRASRARRAPSKGDFVQETQICKKRVSAPPAPTLQETHPPLEAAKPLPKQWPAKKCQYPNQVKRVATIDNITLMNELKRRGLLAPEMKTRPQNYRWTKEEDKLLEEGVRMQGIMRKAPSGKMSPWHAVAQHVGYRSYYACKKRWEYLHPNWYDAHKPEHLLGVENIQLDMLFAEHPADEHYGLMALEEFTDTEDSEDAPPASPTTVLAAFTVPSTFGDKRIAFTFPEQEHADKWDPRRLEEHNLNLHQQRVTSVWLEMRSKRMPDLETSVLA